MPVSISNKLVVTSGRFGRRLWFRVAAVLCIGVAFLVLAVRQSAELASERDTYAYLLRTNNWIASQIEVELLRFLNALDVYVLSPTEGTHDDLVLRFDILWSRLPVFLTGPEAAETRSVPGAIELVTKLRDKLAEVETLVHAIGPGDMMRYRMIREQLQGEEPALNAMVHKLLVGGRHQDLIDRISTSQAFGLLFLAVLLLVGAVIVAFLLFELWRGHRLAVRESAARWSAEVANNAKSQFLANMSHELRTPLNAIIGFSEILKEETFGPLGAEHYKTYATDIHRSGHHLLQILSDILDMAKVEAGGVMVNDEQFEPAKAARDAAHMVGITAMRKNVQITCDTNPEQTGGLLLSGDERLFRQIVVNLLSNAVKFTATEGSIAVKLTVEEGELVLRVCDSGIGIKPDDLLHVTDAFYRVGGAFNSQHEGTGLGLAMVKAFTELHDGRLEIASTPGQGTEVTARFPASRLERAAPGLAQVPAAEVTESAA